MNLFCQHARFMFGSMAMEIIQPLLLHAVEDRLGQKPRDVLEYLLKGYTRQVSKEGSDTLQFSFASFFQLLAQAQEELGGQSWFDMFVTKPNEEDEKSHTGALSTKVKLKVDSPQGWFDSCYTQAADATTTTGGAVMDTSATGAKPADDGSGYDPRLYFLMDLFSGLSL